MELIKCPVCGEEYSPSYPRCPFCEEDGAGPEKKVRARRRIADRQQAQSARGAMIVVLLVVLALLGWYLFGGDLFPHTETPVVPDEQVEPSVPASNPGVSDDPFYEQPTETVIAPEPVAEVDVSNAQLNKSDFTLGRAGEQYTIKLTGTEAVPTWIVDNPNVVTITADGTVTAVANGDTTVRCKVGARELTCTVRVRNTGKSAAAATEPLVVGPAQSAEPVTPPAGTTEPAEPVTPPEPVAPPANENVDVSNAKLSTTDFTLRGKGTKHTIKLSGTEATPAWSSDDTSVATVAADGTVTAVGNGHTTVRCKVGSKELTCIVRVNGAG